MELLKTLLTPATAAKSFAAVGTNANASDAGGGGDFQNFMDTAQSPDKNFGGEKPAAKARPVAGKSHGAKITATSTSKPTTEDSADVVVTKTADPEKSDAATAVAIKPVAGPAETVGPAVPLLAVELPPLISPVLVTLPLTAGFTTNPPAPEKVTAAESSKTDALVIGEKSGGSDLPVGVEIPGRSAGLRPGSLGSPQKLAGSETGVPNAATTTDELAGKTVRAPLPVVGNFRFQNSNLKSAVTAAGLPSVAPLDALATLPQLAVPEAGVPLAMTETAATDPAAENFGFQIPNFKPDAEKSGATTDNAVLGKFSSVAPENTGTGVATDAGVMKKTVKANEVAGLDVQVLPVGKAGAEHGTVSQSHTAMALLRTVEIVNQDFNPSLPMVGATNPVTTEAASVVALPSLGDAHLRTMERTAEMMSLHSVRLAKSDAESMSVVIRPGAGTELSLELRQRDGTVEAHAVLSRGDFQMLNQYWPELQAKLEQRGIKLAPLGGEENFTAADNGNFSRQQQPSREETAQQAAAFAEFTVAMNRGGGATARLATTVGGNEWWA
ncbi:MAG: hypothetical protein RL616_734 [Verrucomicrobiota bacterium]